MEVLMIGSGVMGHLGHSQLGIILSQITVKVWKTELLWLGAKHGTINLVAVK